MTEYSSSIARPYSAIPGNIRSPQVIDWNSESKMTEYSPSIARPHSAIPGNIPAHPYVGQTVIVFIELVYGLIVVCAHCYVIAWWRVRPCIAIEAANVAFSGCKIHGYMIMRNLHTVNIKRCVMACRSYRSALVVYGISDAVMGFIYPFLPFFYNL